VRYALFTLLLLPAVAPADEKLKGIACRSVHLGWTADAGTAFYVEATVRETADGTYFCAAGFNSGYFGIQQLGDGKKVVLFSVWDPTAGDDPKTVADEKRVKALHVGDKVRVKRFGGEGTGGQSFFDFEWKAGDTHRFLVTAEPDPKDDTRVAFAGYFYLPKEKEWKHLVTFSTITNKKTLGGYYSFVEDFKRDKKSCDDARKAEYGNAWVRTAKGEWKAVTEARFTGDSNPAENIDAGPVKGQPQFFIATGGKTENATTKLKEKMTLAKGDEPVQPKDLPVK
jgi:Domain of unknown function (DUF3472)/Domain of unknown function (DUF5077)